MRIFALFISALLTILNGQAAFAQDASHVKMQAQQVSKHVWYVQGQSAVASKENENFISNASFIVTSTGVVVVDALGSPALAKKLLQVIKSVTDKPVTTVIVTHYHADHVYGLQAFKASGAKIIAEEKSKIYINSEIAKKRLEDSRITLKPWINENTHLVLADQWINGPTDLSIGDLKLQLIPVGAAHTPEDLVVYIPEDQTIIVGDLVFRNRLPYVGEADSQHWIIALDQLLNFDAKKLIPGHGPASDDPQKDIKLTRDYLQFLRDSMKVAATNMDDFDTAYKAVNWGRFADVPLFNVANRMNAYNTYLLIEREQK